MYTFRNVGRINFLAVLLFLIAFSFSGAGCSLLKKDKQTIAIKKKEAADKKVAADYEKARKQYSKYQSKGTQEMMKNTKKQAAAYNKPKKSNWLFKPKCK